KVLYALQDVQHLQAIARMQKPLLSHEDLDWVAALENEVVLSYAEMTYHGMELDIPKWRENIELAQPLVDAAKIKLDTYLMQEPFHTKAVELGFISSQDRIEIKWSSPRTREELLRLYVPDIPGASIGVLKRY